MDWLKFGLNFFVMILGAGVLALGLINFLIGCGEPIYYPDGTYETGRCFLINYEPVEGSWK